jgi:hypothetical protein
VDLGRYINSLLLDYDTVIIPGLGAFITEYIPAEPDNENEEMAPPSKKISFEPRIKNNDGLLMGKIAQSEQISDIEALDKIENERDSILFRLDKGEKVTIKNIGILSSGENREILFEPFLRNDLLLDAYGLTGISLREANNKPAEHNNETKEEQEKESGATNKNNSDEYKYADVNESAPPHSEKSNKRKKRGWLWFLFILVIIFAAGIFYIKKEKEKNPSEIHISSEPILPEDTTTSEKMADIPDSANIDSAKISIIDSVKTLAEPADSSGYMQPDTSKYYLITGSFQMEENSVKHLQKLKNKGYNAFHLGKQGNFYIVGIGVYSTAREAFVAQYDFLEKNPDSGAWVFHQE